MADMIISIADRYSPFPAGRYPTDGPFNGERFRDSILMPALRDAMKAGSRVVVVLDGAATYSSSFLEEVFGGLVRQGEMSKGELVKSLEIRADDIAYLPAKRDAERYLAEASPAARR